MTDEELLKAILRGETLTPEEVREITARGPAFGKKLLELVRNVRLWHTQITGEVAVVHAIKLVGSMKMREAVNPFVDAIFLAYSTRNEDAIDDLPIALAQIGPPAMKPLESVLEDRGLDIAIRSVAASALEGIAVLNPDVQHEVLETIRRMVSATDELSALRGHSISILAHFRVAEDRALITGAMARTPMMMDMTADDVNEYFAQNEDPQEWEQYKINLLEYYDELD
jgi:hypothetical protein